MGTLKALKCVTSRALCWTEGKVYVLNSGGFVLDDEGVFRDGVALMRNYGSSCNAELHFDAIYHVEKVPSNISDGSTASYYELPRNATELQHLISHKNMNAQLGEIFRECYRYGTASHCDEMRGIKKILFYANAEKERLEKLNENH
jgi:hypothetical protein